jgi:hypothetical protein
MTVATIPSIAASFNLSESELYQQALVSFLREKKRQALQARLEILARYSTDSLASLEAKIAEGAVAEHPAWEDLIVAENLTASLEELDARLADLRRARSDRAR